MGQITDALTNASVFIALFRFYYLLAQVGKRKKREKFVWGFANATLIYSYSISYSTFNRLGIDRLHGMQPIHMQSRIVPHAVGVF